MSDEPSISQQAQGSYIAQAAHGGSATVNVVLPAVSLTEKQRKQNRMRMLDRVQAIWIKGVLEPSVRGAAQIALELENKPSAVVTPMWQEVREFDTTGRLSSAESSIVQVYDHANEEVLILGEPGAGKTTLLLELTRALLERARQDEAHPIPVVFSLSSWATRRQPLTEWLASELHSRYQVPSSLAISWIGTDQVLPLLDGLDEVAVLHRAACVEAINTYRQAHGLLPTVVCSRQTDYLVLSTRLLLRTAVVVQPLTPEQIETYLESAGEQKALDTALRQDADLRELATTPLMLTILLFAYRGTSADKIIELMSLGAKRELIFASYVQQMLKRRRASKRYQPEQITHWLTSLAWQMKQQNQTLFYLEQMQPTWLSGHHMRGAYDWLAVRVPDVLIGVLVSLTISVFISSGIDLPSLITSILLGGLLGGLLSEGRTPQRPAVSGEKAGSALWPRLLQWLLIGALIGLGSGLIFGMNYGSSGGLLVGLSFGLSAGICSIPLQFLLRKNNMAKARSPMPPPAKGAIWQRLIRRREVHNGLLVGLVVGLSYGLGYELSNGLTDGLIYGPASGLSAGLIYGLSYGLSAGLLSVLLIGRSTAVQPTDLLVLSRRSLGKSLFSKSLASMTVRVIALTGLVVGLSAGLSSGLSTGLGYGLGTGLIFWLLLGLFQGVSSATIEDQRRMVPNQGIRRSALNGLVLGLISTVIVGLLSWLSYGLSDGLSVGLVVGPSYGLSNGLGTGLGIGLIIGLSVGLLAGLHKGGLASLRHYVLRFLLWRTGSVPWHYVPFLDYAAERILLRKVGGGYIFVHRLLLEYFASLDSTPPLDLISPPVNTRESGGDSGSPTPSSALVASLVPQGQIEPRTGRRGLSRREVMTGLVGLGGVLVIGRVAWFLRQWGGPQLPKEAYNLDFAAGTQSWFLAGSHPQDYSYGTDVNVKMSGKASAYLKAGVARPDPNGFGTLMQAFQGIEYRGKRLRMSGYAKAQAIENWAGLWMRVDGNQGYTLSFDNMQNRPIHGTVDWKRYEIVLDVPQESVGIYFGILLGGKGQVWLSDVQFQVVGKEVPTTGS